MIRLTKIALNVLKARYLKKDKKGNVIETPEQLFKRVAKDIAKAEKKSRVKKVEKEFYNLLSNLDFLPNSPTLMNAGNNLQQLASCFVLPIEDSMESIFGSLKDAAIIHQSGGGTGFSFSKLRPKGDIVRSTHGVASGPVSFMRVYDIATEIIKQGGMRRGANMGILNIEHPDIIEFVKSKNYGILNNFNLSVAVKDNFMKKVIKNQSYDLINPRTKKVTKKIKARKIFKLIAEQAWKNGDPGVIFLDEINKHNTLKRLGKIEATNPCGEQPLLAYEACNLGSINLANMVKNKGIDYEKLESTIKLAVRFLDDVVDRSKYPIKIIEEIVKKNRKIGLGVMGFADMLIKLEIHYNSKKALKIADKVVRFVQEKAHKVSEELAKERGAFPNYNKSTYKKKIRNATITTIAPTGTISMIANCSSGIEPLFAIAYMRRVMDKETFIVNPLFEKIAKRERFYSKKLIKKIAQKDSLKGIKEVPLKYRKLFVTAHDIKPELHVKMQAVFQKFTDNAVSKTVNLPEKATKKDVEKIFMLAYKLKCKGITIYRYGSKKTQILNVGKCKVC